MRFQTQAEQDAHNAGADAAATVIHAQVNAGMPTDRIEQSAQRVLADRTAHPTPVSTAFYDAYGEVAHTYTQAARVFGFDASPELEAGA
jgi:hypothetical protein